MGARLVLFAALLAVPGTATPAGPGAPGGPSPAGDTVAAPSPAPQPGPRASEAAHGSGEGGLLARLAERGVVPAAHLLWDGSRVLDGGVRERAASRWLLQAGVDVDLERAVGWRGARAFIGYHLHRGRDGSLDAGDVQAYSNIDAPPLNGLDEAWIEQRLPGGRVRVKAGRIDASLDFACADAAADFLNSSAGYSPTIAAMPTYPRPEPGVSAGVTLAPRTSLGVGVYRSPRASRTLTLTPGHRVVLAELRVGWGGHREGRLRVGAFHESGELERFDGRTGHGTAGSWLVVEQRLWSVPGPGEGGDRERCVTAFLQLGQADEQVTEFAGHLGAGLLVAGPFPGRPGDRLGLMVSRVDLSDVPEAGFPRDETAWEVFYLYRLTPRVLLQPDLQYIDDPSGGATGPDHALVATIRVHLEF